MDVPLGADDSRLRLLISSRLGMSWLGRSGRGLARLVPAGFGVVCFVSFCRLAKYFSWRGEAGYGLARHGSARLGWVMLKPISSNGLVGFCSWYGKARPGGAWHGPAWRGLSRRCYGIAILAGRNLFVHGEARRGMARRGLSCHGRSGRGSVGGLVNSRPLFYCVFNTH